VEQPLRAKSEDVRGREEMRAAPTPRRVGDAAPLPGARQPGNIDGAALFPFICRLINSAFPPLRASARGGGREFKLL
jgi:hypothetical protein